MATCTNTYLSIGNPGFLAQFAAQHFEMACIFTFNPLRVVPEYNLNLGFHPRLFTFNPAGILTWEKLYCLDYWKTTKIWVRN